MAPPKLGNDGHPLSRDPFGNRPDKSFRQSLHWPGSGDRRSMKESWLFSTERRFHPKQDGEQEKGRPPHRIVGRKKSPRQGPSQKSGCHCITSQVGLAITLWPRPV